MCGGRSLRWYRFLFSALLLAAVPIISLSAEDSTETLKNYENHIEKLERRFLTVLQKTENLSQELENSKSAMTNLRENYEAQKTQLIALRAELKDLQRSLKRAKDISETQGMRLEKLKKYSERLERRLDEALTKLDNLQEIYEKQIRNERRSKRFWQGSTALSVIAALVLAFL